MVCQEEGEAVDGEIKTEDKWQFWLSPLESPQLNPNRCEFTIRKEENVSCNNAHKKDDTED